MDIGANIGNHSVYLAPEFEQVYSFEPNRRTFMLLQANAMLRSNISTFNIGLSDRKETRQVVFSPTNVGAASVERDSLPENSQTASFELDRLDDLPILKNRTDIDLIKIDVEGHELEALKGAEETLKRCTPCICMEVLKSEIEDGSSKALQFLKSIGYSHFYTLESRYDRDNISGVSAWVKYFFHAIFLNHRLDKELSIKPVTELKYKHYPLLICSHQDLVQS
ncbi:MAG: FkbM family methyltransferase [Candidatus Brocadiaceae bacterium]|nr:FkbM family methyltransferase [Candidatus Brocadiaceae bacterium]